MRRVGVHAGEALKSSSGRIRMRLSSSEPQRDRRLAAEVLPNEDVDQRRERLFYRRAPYRVSPL